MEVPPGHAQLRLLPVSLGEPWRHERDRALPKEVQRAMEMVRCHQSYRY
jgi:hypothetical protein